MNFQRFDEEGNAGKMPYYIYNLSTNNVNFNKNPKDENFCDYLTKLCCIDFNYKTAPVIMIGIQFLIFFIMVICTRQFSEQFLGISDQVLHEFGSLCLSDLLKGRVWLLITSSFLNESLYSLILNCCVILFFGYQMFELYDNKTFLLIYGIGVLGGNMIFINISQDTIAGSQNATFALAGSMLGHWYMYYDEFEQQNSCAKYNLLMNTAFICFIFMQNASTSIIIIELVCIILGALTINAYKQIDQKKKNICVMILSIYFFVQICLIVVFRK